MLAKTKVWLLSLIFISTLLGVVLPPTVFAQPQSKPSTNGHCGDDYIRLNVPLQGGNDCVLKTKDGTPIEENSIIIYVRKLIQFLSAGVGIVVVLMIVISGIQFITSTGNPQATASARGRLSNAVIALFLFIFMVVLLNFIIPGGVFS